jgi:hypothetical protein
MVQTILGFLAGAYFVFGELMIIKVHNYYAAAFCFFVAIGFFLMGLLWNYDRRD